MPGTSRIFEASFVKPPPLGLYKGLARIQVGNLQKTTAAQPLMLLTAEGGVILLAIIGIVWFKIHHRKRIWSAIKILFHGGR
jgi:hypothetical protein